MNYFRVLCFIWAIVGLVTRFLIVSLGVSWKEWELGKAYTRSKPRWIYFVAVFAFMVVTFTWYKVFTTEVRYSWIMALLVSLTLIKVFLLIFNYERFRSFIENILNDRKKLTLLNISVLVFSIIFMLMGMYLY